MRRSSSDSLVLPTTATRKPETMRYQDSFKVVSSSYPEPQSPEQLSQGPGTKAVSSAPARQDSFKRRAKRRGSTVASLLYASCSSLSMDELTAESLSASVSASVQDQSSTSNATWTSKSSEAPPRPKLSLDFITTAGLRGSPFGSSFLSLGDMGAGTLEGRKKTFSPESASETTPLGNFGTASMLFPPASSRSAVHPKPRYQRHNSAVRPTLLPSVATTSDDKSSSQKDPEASPSRGSDDDKSQHKPQVVQFSSEPGTFASGTQGGSSSSDSGPLRKSTASRAEHSRHRRYQRRNSAVASMLFPKLPRQQPSSTNLEDAPLPQGLEARPPRSLSRSSSAPCNVESPAVTAMASSFADSFLHEKDGGDSKRARGQQGLKVSKDHHDASLTKDSILALVNATAPAAKSSSTGMFFPMSSSSLMGVKGPTTSPPTSPSKGLMHETKAQSSLMASRPESPKILSLARQRSSTPLNFSNEPTMRHGGSSKQQPCDQPDDDASMGDDTSIVNVATELVHMLKTNSRQETDLNQSIRP